MSSDEHADVLRDVAMQEHVRALLRPGRVGGAAGRPSSTTTAATTTHPPGYADGFELGRREGRIDGEAEGQRTANARCEAALQRSLDANRRDADRADESSRVDRAAFAHRFEQLLEGFQCAAAERLRLLEDDAVALAFEAVCRLIGQGHGQSGQLAASIAVAMGPLNERPVLRVRIRPDGLALLASSSQGRSLTEAFSSVEWLADPRIEGDGCILDNALGSIDARMETQLGRLRQSWSDAMRQTPDEALRAPGE